MFQIPFKDWYICQTKTNGKEKGKSVMSAYTSHQDVIKIIQIMEEILKKCKINCYNMM